MIRAKKFLDFFRFLDENGTLSLSNIAVMVILVKLAIAPVLDFTEVAALLGVLSTYSFKRYTQRKAAIRDEKLAKDLEAWQHKVQSQVDRVTMAVGITSHENNQ